MACHSFPIPDRDASSEFRLKSILLPTDFGDASDRAARVARGLAAHFRSRLQVVHAVWQRDYEWDEAVYQMGASESAGRMRCEEFVAVHGLDSEITVMPGCPTEVVQTIAAEKNSDLLVLGTNGLPWPAKLLFGTYSEQIYRNARCPVLTVGPYVRPAKCTGDFKSIVCAISSESETAARALQPNEPTAPSLGTTLQYAIGLTRACDARLTVACVLPRSFGSNGEELYRVQDKLKTEKRAQLLQLLGEIQPALPHPPEIVVETGHISDGMIKIAMRSNADLIVKSARPSGPDSFAGYRYPISVNAPCPVLTVSHEAIKKPPMRWPEASPSASPSA